MIAECQLVGKAAFREFAVGEAGTCLLRYLKALCERCERGEDK